MNGISDSSASYILMSLIFFLPGIFLVIRGFVRMKRLKNNKIMSITKGKVIYSEVMTDDYRVEDFVTPVYKPVIKYQYSVNNNKYTSTRLSATPDKYTSSNKTEMNILIKKYQKNQVVDVYYDPNEESYSLLDPEASSKSMLNIKIHMMFGMLLTLVSLYVMRIYL